MIASIEQAIKQRLSDGLGQMVTGVFTYGGEFDGEGLAQVVNQFPAVWVLFNGIKNTVPHDTRRTRYKVTAEFAVLVGDEASGSEADSRFGGLHRHDVGTYRLMNACRLLLGNQSLGLKIDPLQPRAARSLFNQRMENDALSVFAVEFETHWFENALQNGDWPEAGSHGDIDDYYGQTQTTPDFIAANLELRRPPKTHPAPADMQAHIDTVEKTP